MLRVSLKTEYALRALMELAARRRDGGLIPAREIAKAQGIPLKFLEHQLAAMHKAGIVESSRGASGGVMLARAPEDIRIAEVVNLFEASLAPMSCLEEHHTEECSHSHQCGLQELWSRVETAVRAVFEQTTIADLTHRHRELQPLLWPSMMVRDT